MNEVSGILIALLSVGGATFLATLFKGVQQWRNGAQASEARAIVNLEKYRNEADARAERAEIRADRNQELIEFWRTRAGDLEFIIVREQGKDAVPPLPALPALSSKPRPKEVGMGDV